MFPEHWNLVRVIRHGLAEILTNQHTIIADGHHILANQEKLMSKLDDVKAKLNKLSTDVDAFIAANQGGASDADLTDIGTALDVIDAKIAPPA